MDVQPIMSALCPPRPPSRLAVGDRSCANNAPSSRGCVVNGLTVEACETLPPPPPSIAWLCPTPQVQEGRNGRSDTLLVSQFGFTRGGVVSRVDLDPTPQLPRIFARLEGAVRGSAAAAAAVSEGVLSRRAQPRLTGTWAGPLLWPNEVNQVRAAGCLA